MGSNPIGAIMEDELIIEVARSLLSGSKPLSKADFPHCRYPHCRYGEILQALLEELDAVVILREVSNCDYQGDVDVDILLSDGRLICYYYSYGSCSGCDTWEAESLTDEQIKEEMKTGATYFSSFDEYQQWNKMRKV